MTHSTLRQPVKSSFVPLDLLYLLTGLFLLCSSTGFAQRCGGELYFRIYDLKGNQVFPITADTVFMKIANGADIGTGRHIDGRKLPVSDLHIKTLKTEGNAGTASISLMKYPFTDLLFHFSTGCYTQLKKISIIKGKEKMILNLVDIPAEASILMDSIPFVAGEVSYNLSQIIRRNKLDDYRTPPGSKFYLTYVIPYQYSKTELKPLAHVTSEYKNDSLYYYSDSLKTNVSSKGKVKIQKLKVQRRYGDFDTKDKKNIVKRIVYLKRGVWTYYFENYTLQVNKNDKKIKKNRRRHFMQTRHTMEKF